MTSHVGMSRTSAGASKGSREISLVKGLYQRDATIRVVVRVRLQQELYKALRNKSGKGSCPQRLTLVVSSAVPCDW